jgi:pyridoxal phosphate enzyme (YggS family)
MTDPAHGARRAVLAAALTEVRARIVAAAAAAERDAAELTLVAVTKTYPASDVRLLAELGVHDIGENRDQEAAGKHSECADLDLRWHFVGQLQRRRAGSVARYADVVHSVDRPELAATLGRAAVAAGRVVLALVQVCLDDLPAPGRGGIDPAAAVELAARVAATDGLALGGVMGVAPRGGDPGTAFRRLAEVSALVRAEFPGASVVSAGMSDDLEAAVAQGATHLRVGTALLGRRPDRFG